MIKTKLLNILLPFNFKAQKVNSLNKLIRFKIEIHLKKSNKTECVSLQS
jgi:hypothetical protein